MPVILNITMPGMYISLSGIPPFRTPAKIDITNKNVPLIITELKKSGIQKFNITTEEIESPFVEKKKEAIKPGDNVNSRLDNIEVMLKQLLERKPELVREFVLEESKSKALIDDIETDDDFIPTIDTELKMEGSTSIETIETELDNESVGALTKVGNKNTYKK